MSVCRGGQRRNSQRACGSSPADERQQSENGFLCTVLILLDSFFLFRLNDYWRKGKQRTTIPHVHHPQKDAGWILCTHRPDMSARERCVKVWGPVLGAVTPRDWLLNQSSCIDLPAVVCVVDNVWSSRNCESQQKENTAVTHLSDLSD